MTDFEIADHVRYLSRWAPTWKYPRIETRADLVKLIAGINAGEACLKQLGGDDSAEFTELCLGFNPDRIVAAGRMRLGEDLIHALGEDLKTPIKKYLQSLVLTARFVQSFPTVERFRKEYLDRFTSLQSLIEILEGFRRESKIFGMHMSKACDIMLLSRTLPTPRFPPEVKTFLRAELNLGEANAPIYLHLLKIQEKSLLDPLHFSECIYKLATQKSK